LNSLAFEQCLLFIRYTSLFSAVPQLEKEEDEGPAELFVLSQEEEQLASLHRINRTLAGTHYPEAPHYTDGEHKGFVETRAAARRMTAKSLRAAGT
jgi:hypothetical protein